MGLLALFAIIRAYGQDKSAREGSRYVLHPGVLEFETAEGSARIAFGLIDQAGGGGQGRMWELFPVRVAFSSGKQSFSLSLNGLSFLAPGGVRMGRPVRINGLKAGDVISIGGEVTVAGTVDGDVWTLGANIKLLPQAVVTGSAVALGGSVEASRGAVIKGNKYSLPNVKIPFVRLLSSEQSAATFRFLIEVLGVILYLLVLFLVVHFARHHLIGLNGTLASYWKGSILYLLLAVFLIPLILLLLVTSILGILLVPFVVIAAIVLAYLGFVAVSVRLGLALRRQKAESPAGAAYTSGLLGLLVIKGPALLGILFSLLTTELFQGIGRLLFVIGSIEMIVAALYGFGGTLKYLRVQAGSRS